MYIPSVDCPSRSEDGMARCRILGVTTLSTISQPFPVDGSLDDGRAISALDKREYLMIIFIISH